MVETASIGTPDSHWFFIIVPISITMFFGYPLFSDKPIYQFLCIEPNYLGITIVLSVKGLTHSRLINAITVRSVLSKAGAILLNKIVFTKRDNANMMDIH